MQTRNIPRTLGFGNPKLLIVTAISLCALLPLRSACGNQFDDIFNRATQARDRATEARDIATTARNNAATARDNAANARDQAIEIRDTIQSGLQTLTGQVRTFINDSVQEASRIVTEETQGRDEFVNGPTGPAFRQDLITLLQNLQTVFTQLALIGDPAAAPISFDDQIQLIQTIPLQVLFPFYRAMEGMRPLFGNLPTKLADAATALPVVRQILESRYTGAPLGAQPVSFIDYELAQPVNARIMNNPVGFSVTIQTVRITSVACKVIGAYSEAKSETGVTDIKAGIHGYAGVSLKSDPRKKHALLHKGLGELLEMVADWAGDNLDHAMLIGSISELRDNQTTILQNQEKILYLLNPAGTVR